MIMLERQKKLSCAEFGLMMVAYEENDPGLSRQERESYERHLQVCSSCRAEYKEDRKFAKALAKSWKSNAEQGDSYDEFLKWPGPGWKFQTTDEAWADLCRRIREYEQQRSRRRRIHKIFRTGIAAAASIAIAVSVGWMVFHRQLSSNTAQEAVVVTRIHPDTSRNAFAELVEPSGRQGLALGQPVTAGDQLREIMLGGMHRVVMNKNTRATFFARAIGANGDNRQLQYNIELAKGELYVEVVPGHPFVVRTDNALLRITGTKFAVWADPDQTDLVLVKGSVRFSQIDKVNQYLDVSAGHCSSISGGAAPTVPGRIDAAAATSWARDFIMRNTLAHVRPGLDEDFLDSICDSWMRASPPKLAEIDYRQWLEEHREWFGREFPWIFKVQEILREQHDINADYVELLIISGDIWQFNYPRPLHKPIPKFDPAAVGRIAKYYKVESSQLLKVAQRSSSNPPATDVKPATTSPSTTYHAEAYLSAMENWQVAIAFAAATPDGLPSDLLLFSLHAGTYLTDTRTAAYLWVKENPDKARALLAEGKYWANFLSEKPPVTPEHLEALTKQLYSGAIAAANARRLTQELFTTPQSSDCEACVQEHVRALRRQLSTFAGNAQKAGKEDKQ